MNLFNVYYWDRSFDKDVPLPKPDGSIRYAQNTNWDHRILVPRKKRDGTFEWHGSKAIPALVR